MHAGIYCFLHVYIPMEGKQIQRRCIFYNATSPHDSVALSTGMQSVIERKQLRIYKACVTVGRLLKGYK